MGVQESVLRFTFRFRNTLINSAFGNAAEGKVQLSLDAMTSRVTIYGAQVEVLARFDI